MSRLAIVGTGPDAGAYATRIQEHGGMAMAGVAPSDGAPSTSTAIDATHDDYESLFDETDPDGVVLCVAPDDCLGPVVAAAERGVALLRPGPLAGNLADADGIVEAVDTAEVVALGGYPSSFSPEHDTAVDRATNGTLGTVGNVRLLRTVANGDTTNDALVGPDVEFLRRIGGEVNHVFSRPSTGPAGAGLLGIVRLVDDAVGHLDARRGIEDRRRFELAGTEGLIEYDSEETAPIRIRQGPDTNRQAPLQADGIARQLRHFQECLMENATPRISLQEARSTLHVGRALQASAERDSPIAPDEVAP